MSLTKSNIEYLTHAWNFYPGCYHQQQGICPIKGCWAKSLDTRFGYGKFTPRLLPERLLDPLRSYNPEKPRRIGVCFTGDLFGDWVDPQKMISVPWASWTDKRRHIRPVIGYADLKDIVFSVVKECPDDTFIFLTKRPARLALWGRFPDNAWVGATAWDNNSLWSAMGNLRDVNAKHKWLSLEPLLGKMRLDAFDLHTHDIRWVVIGQCTPIREKTLPKLHWLQNILTAADKAGCNVWLKNNLGMFYDLLMSDGSLRQENGDKVK